MTPERWAKRIHKGAARAERRYAHLSDGELDELATRRKISRPVYEYLRAARLGRAKAGAA